MEAGDGVVVGRALGAEVAQPRERLGIERRLDASASHGRLGDRRCLLHAMNHRRDGAHAASTSSSSGARIRSASAGAQPRSTSSIRA